MLFRSLSQAVFCYGDIIYNPSKKELNKDIIHHEEIHSKQQGTDPNNWYHNYLTNPNFRLEQELQAYASQLNFAKNLGVKGKLLKWKQEQMAEALSADYKLKISFREAESKIRNKAKDKIG